MKRKARIQTGIDDRLVAIYARKSRITNKGDSIGVQFKQSADYAINQLSLPEDYEFARYEDKGLSGYYSDRPDFQRLLRDIEMGKIKAVACYKLDRISRKTSDLMRLLEYFERHDVTLLVCSNNINTRISTSKIIIQVLAIIAEFERDILTERIQDNLMELAKDGRWLGGKTPTGFSSQRVTTGSGKNKSAISFLVPVQEEKEIVLEIYGTFWETRSLLQTANIISEKYETKHGAKFTTSTIRLILRNPIYCVADEYSYNYFLEHDGNLFGEPSDFDGQHGLTAYNKTDQMKVENEDSTFFNPKFSQLLTRKPISEWIVSVGRHEGFISSRKWVETQNMLDEIAEKYNRPHRKTNALLSGLMYCPICGKRLRVLPESNRWTNGKPRFKYACPGVRAKECTFKGVEGVTLDEFVIHSLSSLQEEYSDYYRQLLENRVASMIRTDQSEKEYQETKKAIERLNADIAAQVRNLREADDALKRFIQDDIKELTDELAKREAALRRMEDTQSENQYLVHELNGMKKRLLSFEEFAKDAQPEALFTLVHSIVDRIYITTDGTKQKCQVYIKGCATEDYSDVLGAAGYIEEEPLLPVVSYMPPMCDLDYYSILFKPLHRTMRHARRADGEDALVEDDLRVVRGVLSALVHVARAKVHHCARHTFGHKGKVLGARRRNAAVRRKVRNVQRAHVAQHVVRHRFVAHERAHFGKRPDLHCRVIHGSRALRRLAHAAYKQCAGLFVVRADGAAQHGRVRDDVRGGSGHKLPDCQNARLCRVAFARDELLQGEMNVHAYVDGVNGKVRVRTVRAAPVNRNLKSVYGSHHHA